MNIATETRAKKITPTSDKNMTNGFQYNKNRCIWTFPVLLAKTSYKVRGPKYTISRKPYMGPLQVP